MKKLLSLSTIAATILLVSGFSFSTVASAKVSTNKNQTNTTTTREIPSGILHAPGIEKRIENGKGLPPGIEKTKISTSTADTASSRLFGIMVINRTQTSAHVVWATSKRADSKVWVSTQSSVNTSTAPTASSANLVFLHNLAMTNLAPNTQYYYVIGSTDASGNTTVSEVKSFTTKALPESDTTAPQIFGPFVLSIDTDSAVVVWGTNERSDSKLWLSTGTPVNTSGAATISSSGMLYFHSLDLINLSSSTTYHYVISSTDSSGNTTMSAEKSFITDVQ